MRIVVVGGGQAGGWAARTIAQSGYGHEVILIGEEQHPPYERPPLSKEVLLGEAPASDCYMWNGDPGFTVHQGVRVAAIDRKGKSLMLDGGGAIAYDRLLIATGGRVRRIDRPDTHYVRTIEDAQGLGAAMTDAASMLVVGGGWIGLEVAAAGRKKGLAVTVVEMADRLCGRVMPPVISDYLHDLHERHGVTLHYRATPGDFASDIVVAGIGIMPNVELAEAAGLAIDNGIAVDEYGQTSDPDIFAAGDVTSRNGLRIESWANAQNQAISAAKSVAGDLTPYHDTPWFWSTQYGVNMQFLGLFEPADRIVVRGDPAQDSFCVFFLDTRMALRSAVIVNQPRELRMSRKLIEAGSPLDPDALADPSVKLADAVLLAVPSQS